jgi:hypothetical protein
MTIASDISLDEKPASYLYGFIPYQEHALIRANLNASFSNIICTLSPTINSIQI